MEKICGIYKITSPTGRVYIGQSTDINLRIQRYKKRGCKRQTKLHASFEKYTAEAHVFEIIEICHVANLNELEVYHINRLGTFNSDAGLNLKAGGSHGTHSDETRSKIGNAHRGKIVSDETRAKMSASQLANSAALNERISKRNIGNKYASGRKLSQERIQQLNQSRVGIPAAMLGKKHSKETIEKMRAAKIGKIVTKETGAKISAANRGRKMSPEWKNKIRVALIGNKNRSSSKKRVATNQTALF